MVSPGNRGDETCGGILSKDFGFRPRMHARELSHGEAAGGVKNFRPGWAASRLAQ
jgi:hypothetical protein